MNANTWDGNAAKLESLMHSDVVAASRYYTTGKLNEKSDVYGYGILMMEVLTGRAPVVPSADPNHIFILDWVRQHRLVID